MTNPKKEPTTETEKVDPSKKNQTQHETGSHDTSPDTAEGRSKKVDNQN